jgi:hypothetical protein
MRPDGSQSRPNKAGANCLEVGAEVAPDAGGLSLRRRATIRPASAVAGWLGAFNAHDLDGMLSRMDPQVDFRPLRMSGAEPSYEGHDGVRRWFETHMLWGDGHRLDVSELRDTGEGWVLLIGALELPGQPKKVQVCATYRVPEGLIVAARHYFSDLGVLERVGVDLE